MKDINQSQEVFLKLNSLRLLCVNASAVSVLADRLTAEVAETTQRKAAIRALRADWRI